MKIQSITVFTATLGIPKREIPVPTMVLQKLLPLFQKPLSRSLLTELLQMELLVGELGAMVRVVEADLEVLVAAVAIGQPLRHGGSMVDPLTGMFPELISGKWFNYQVTTLLITHTTQILEGTLDHLVVMAKMEILKQRMVLMEKVDLSNMS
jgi:hypothetical protein